MLNLLSYPRSVVATVFCGLWTIVMSVVVLTIAFLTRNQKWLDIAINTMWSRLILNINGVAVRLRGEEGVRKVEKGFLILFNHSSHMDIPVLYAYFPRRFRFGAKIELFKIPFFGAAMRVCGVLPIDRGNRNKVMKVYEEAIVRVNRGECFALAPEGTRQPEPKLGGFKRGPFEFAINAQMDIVPVVMAGTYAVLPRKSIWINMGKWRRTVLMQILPPVSTFGLSSERAEELMSTVRAQMLAAHDRLYAELPGF